MQPARFLECLDADYRRIHDVVSRADLGAPVPSCPGWTVKDLVEHTAQVYLHKVEVTKLGREPDKWASECRDVLEPADGDTLLVDAGGNRWLAEIGIDGVDVSRAGGMSATTVSVLGAPSDVLFWLWNRAAPSDGAVEIRGEPDAVERLRALLVVCTQ